MSEPTIRDVRDQLQYAIAQLRHAYQQLFSHDERWSRRGMQQFADGLIAPQIRKLEQVDRLLAALAVPPTQEDLPPPLQASLDLWHENPEAWVRAWQELIQAAQADPTPAQEQE